MRIVLLCVGLLLSGAGALAQGQKKPTSSTPDTAGKVAVPVRPALPGEEKLTAQERVERDFLMPVRRKMQPVAPKPEAAVVAPAGTTAQHVATTPALEASASAIATEKSAETAASPAAAAAPRRHYTRSRHRSAASRKASRKKSVTKKKTAARRRR
ncbi:hypothetical protein FY528_09910 [Hymenobacter lutimineralis]|uniref:Uncharacterized protein n=1 Tax=Hymenobacter lutimineralis TaxID=2606448 RepID=A0A5D6V213_9BACT|nr:hypothetical protein [Hymenobacter lutimineralis]TYZ09550.1 hypothetical protein FY528_09910 [Hymenobacter lutimineralis]